MQYKNESNTTGCETEIKHRSWKEELLPAMLTALLRPGMWPEDLGVEGDICMSDGNGRGEKDQGVREVMLAKTSHIRNSWRYFIMKIQMIKLGS